MGDVGSHQTDIDLTTKSPQRGWLMLRLLGLKHSPACSDAQATRLKNLLQPTLGRPLHRPIVLRSTGLDLDPALARTATGPYRHVHRRRLALGTFIAIALFHDHPREIGESERCALYGMYTKNNPSASLDGPGPVHSVIQGEESLRSIRNGG